MILPTFPSLDHRYHLFNDNFTENSFSPARVRVGERARSGHSTYHNQMVHNVQQCVLFPYHVTRTTVLGMITLKRKERKE